MKATVILTFSLLILASCSGERQSKDQTNPREENISPNQTQSEEEQARKDSIGGDIVGKDTAAAKVNR
jgi:hypothetical protein